MKISVIKSSEMNRLKKSKKKIYLNLAVVMWSLAIITTIVNMATGMSETLSGLNDIFLILSLTLMLADTYQSHIKPNANPIRCMDIKLNPDASDSKDTDKIDPSEKSEFALNFNTTAYSYLSDYLRRCQSLTKVTDVNIGEIIQEQYIDAGKVPIVIDSLINAIAFQRKWPPPMERFAYEHFRNHNLTLSVREIIEWTESKVSVICIMEDSIIIEDLEKYNHKEYGGN